MESADKLEVKKSARGSRKVKNLEEEVELIFSQDESDKEIDMDDNNDKLLQEIPSRNDKIKEVSIPSAQSVHEIWDNKENVQTPRRSCRKSIKPTQDYDDIVGKSLRFCTRSAIKSIRTLEEKEEKDVENEPKWTPAKVGRISQKRSRKSKRNGKGKEKGAKELVKIGNASEQEMNECLDNTKHQEIELVYDAKENEIYVEKTSVKNESNETEGKAIKEEIGLEAELVDNKPLAIRESNKSINIKTEVTTSSDSKRDFIQEMEGIDIDEQVQDIDLEDSIHLIQEDTEDCNESIQNSEEDAICIVYENNISSNQVIESEEHVQAPENSFGCYLKSNEICISDLGLNPLKDEEEDNEIIKRSHRTSCSQVDEEMPSLIVYDDEDIKPTKKLNETFEANNSTEIVDKSPIKSVADNMATLEMFDDHGSETPKKQPRIVLTNTELENQTILSTPSTSIMKVRFQPTPKALNSPKLPSTPKQSVKPIRLSTPYRQTGKKSKEKATSKCANNKLTISLTTMEPKEIVLRGIRKRSLSVCIDGNEVKRQHFLAGTLTKAKQDRMVSFYSPANQTAIIDDLDIIIAKSLKKEKPLDSKESFNKFVTTRRKRSTSFDDSKIDFSYITKLPGPVIKHNVSTKSQTSSSSSKPVSRTKLPNFAAIHQKQFQKMENLVDHINRKQERSKNLINSATKLRPASAKKNVSLIKNNNNVPLGKPKALKKIDLGGPTQMNKLLNIGNESLISTQENSNLPDPRTNLNKALKSGTISHRQPQQKRINKYLKPSQAANVEKPPQAIKSVPIKPAFNLSTSVTLKPNVMPFSSSFVAKSSNTSLMSIEDKTSSRLQRHMNLFKGRGVSSRDRGVDARKNDILLRGVRSNRRFELQMQHRKNMEQ